MLEQRASKLFSENLMLGGLDMSLEADREHMLSQMEADRSHMLSSNGRISQMTADVHTLDHTPLGCRLLTN